MLEFSWQICNWCLFVYQVEKIGSSWVSCDDILWTEQAVYVGPRCMELRGPDSVWKKKYSPSFANISLPDYSFSSLLCAVLQMQKGGPGRRGKGISWGKASDAIGWWFQYHHHLKGKEKNNLYSHSPHLVQNICTHISVLKFPFFTKFNLVFTSTP